MRRLLRSAVAAMRPDPASRAWPVLAAARSVVTDAPVLAVPAARRVLAVAPHPDDEVLAFGGTLHRMARRGALVEVVLLTDGEASIGTGLAEAEIARRRRDEATAACAALGLGRPEFLGLPDGRLSERVDDATRRLAPIVADLEPDAVFAPWFGDDHPDHRATAAAVAGLDLSDRAEIWGAEVWTPLPPNHLVPLDDEAAAAKARALACHVTAAGAFDTGALLALDRYRSVIAQAGVGRAEAFLVTDPATHRRLLAG